MRFIILIALCLAVASASYTNRNRFNRLLRSLQRQQQQGEFGGYGPQGLLYLEDQDQDEDQEYQQQYKQCSRNQRCSFNLDDDDTEYDIDEQDQDEYQQYQKYQPFQKYQKYPQDQDEEDQFRGPFGQGRQEWDEEDQFRGPFQRQGRQQEKRRQQQRNQCQPKYNLLQELEQPNCQLAAKLYKQAKHENDDKNTVVSPAALQLALAAIQRGARGESKRQLQRIIGAGLTKQQNRQAHTALQQSLQGQDPIQRQTGQPKRTHIKTTTTIVINQRSHAQHQFIQAVQACLNTQVKKCNFQRQPQQCRQQINRYVAQKTNLKLKQTVPQDAITENTKMIIVNTAQVKARWGRQFRQQQQTKQGRFFPLGSQHPKRVQVLQSQGQFPYYEDEQLQVVGVPTQQQEMTLYVIVPKNKDGLNQVEKSQVQDGQQLKQLLEQAEQQQQLVELELPKFQIKHKLDAKQTLRKQGVQHIFDADEADLSAINGQQPREQNQRRYRQRLGQDDEEQYQQYQDQEQRQHQLHVNKLIHQCTIKVDEQGISAAQPRPGQEQYQGQYQPQYDEEDNDEVYGQDEQEEQYYQQQGQRQELFEEIFGQGQRRQRHQRQRNNRRQLCDEEGQCGDEKRVKANRAFAFALKHNPSNQIVLVGRVVDAAQKPRPQQPQRQQGQQSLNGVDQQ